MRKQFSEQELLGKPLSEEQKAEILKLSAISDDDIDTSDIPEIRALPPNTVRGRFYRGATVQLSEEIRRHFADLAIRKGVPLDELVNETLAKAVEFADTIK
jgi:hypothetical protein